MIAFHFPPLRGSSGIQRTLKFVQYLPALGWTPLVLSARPSAYESTSPDQLADVPDGTVVERAFAIDTARHLALRRRYPRWLALPDRWVSWLAGALPAGWRMIRRHRPEAIWSTYPIATAHLVGLALHRLTGLPWIADMRDPMTDDGYPAERTMRRLYRWIEAQAARRAARVVCTTPGAVADYRARFPEVPPERFVLIENGYDEEHFAAAEGALQREAPGPRDGGRFTLLHSGVVYPSERDPTQLFAALASLKRAGAIDAARLRVVFRAAGHGALLAAMLREHGIDDIVELAPPVPYREALREMLTVDGLLILQAANCNRQVPAKLYEYLRARRPVLALTDPAGDTAAVLRAAGAGMTARLDDADEIARVLPDFLAQARRNAVPCVPASACAAWSRRGRARQLADLFSAVAPTATGHPAMETCHDTPLP